MDANKQKNLTIVAIIAVFITLLVVWFINNRAPTSATYTLKFSPMDATVLLDGKSVKAGKVTVKNGTHTLVGTRKYFTKATKQIDTKNDIENSTIFLILGADTPEAAQYIADHPEEQTIREGAGDTIASKIRDNISEKYPYVTQLPHDTLDYVLDYHVNKDNTISLDVTLKPISSPADSDYKAELQDYKNEATDYMNSIDIDTTKVKINWTPDPAKL